MVSDLPLLSPNPTVPNAKGMEAARVCGAVFFENDLGIIRVSERVRECACGGVGV